MIDPDRIPTFQDPAVRAMFVALVEQLGELQRQINGGLNKLGERIGTVYDETYEQTASFNDFIKRAREGPSTKSIEVRLTELTQRVDSFIGPVDGEKQLELLKKLRVTGHWQRIVIGSVYVFAGAVVLPLAFALLTYAWKFFNHAFLG